MPNKRSPLKDRPLRNPGQSPDEQIHDFIETSIGGPLFLAMFAVLLAGLEWWRYYYPGTPVPRLYSFMAGIIIIYATFRVYRALPKLNALKLGRDGEKAVAQFLDRFRESGYRVFHDVVANGFNVDHVPIGPAGVFTVETKTTLSRAVMRKLCSTARRFGSVVLRRIEIRSRRPKRKRIGCATY